VHHYCLPPDRLGVDDVRFSTYENHREVRPFQLMCSYTGCCHLPERVKRQLDFVQDVPRHPSAVAEMPMEMLATVLLDPVAWFYPDWRQRCQRA
jgi:hypothetical protein